jgi:hypothetical protein
MIEFDFANAKQSDGWRATNASCGLPVSSSSDWLFLYIAFGSDLGLTTTLTTPTVAGVAATVVSAAGSRVAIFAIPGGSTGFASFTFPTNPASFWAWCERVSGLKISGPWTNANAAAGTGFSHSINAAVNSPHLGSVYLAAIGSEGGSGGYFHSNDNIATFEGFSILSPGSNGTMLSVAAAYATAAGQAAGHTWNKLPVDIYGGATSGMAGIWLNPLQAPSAPIVTAPVTNGKFTAGSTVVIAWEGASDPNVDTEDLIYKIYLSEDSGFTYGTLLTTTAAGVLTYDWVTTGYSAGIKKIKVVANNGTDDGEPGYSGEFQLFTDVAPSAPFSLSPVGYISQAAKDFTWVANNPDFDTQSAYELEYSSSPAMTSSTTTGTVVSAVSLKNFGASTGILATPGTYYWRVRTKGVVDNTLGAWSEVATVIVAAAPATPTITSSATATTAIWPVTWSGIAHTKFRHRWILSGTERFNSIVQSSAFTFNSPFNLANGEVWTVKVSVFDPASGLESAEASQTLTVTYTGPATPTIEVVALDEQGAIQIAITNSDTIDHSRILRQTVYGGDEYIVISPKLGNDALFLDYHAASDIGGSGSDEILYRYKARSYKVTTLGFTDSGVVELLQTLSKLHIHVVDKVSTTSNAGLKVALDVVDEVTKKYVKKQRSVGHQGRGQFITYAGQAKHIELTYNCLIKRAEDTTTYPALEAVHNANLPLSIRDLFGNKIFGRILELPKTDLHATIRFTITCIEEFHQEGHVR